MSLKMIIWGDTNGFIFSIIESVQDPFEFLSRLSVVVDGEELRRDFFDRILKIFHEYIAGGELVENFRD